MAHVIVQDHHLSDIRKERQNNTEFIEKLFNFRNTFHDYLFGLQFYLRHIAPVFPKSNKCFALKQVHYATVIQYISRVHLEE